MCMDLGEWPECEELCVHVNQRASTTEEAPNDHLIAAILCDRARGAQKKGTY